VARNRRKAVSHQNALSVASSYGYPYPRGEGKEVRGVWFARFSKWSDGPGPALFVGYDHHHKRWIVDREMYASGDPSRRRRRAVRIPRSRRAATSRRVERLVARGYSPRYAAEKAYGRRDPGKLTAAERRKIPRSRYALPKRRALPLGDARHVRNAASRLEQMRKRGTVTLSEYRSARRRIEEARKRLTREGRWTKVRRRRVARDCYGLHYHHEERRRRGR
jgi:hypothetical protein